MISLLSFIGIVQAAHAQTPCFGIEGVCNGSGYNVISAISPVGQLIVSLAAGLSVLFVVIGGAMMLISAGDESQAGKGRNYVIYSLIGFAITLMSQAIVVFVLQNSYVISNSNFAPYDFMGVIVSMMLLLFNTTFVVVVIIAGFRMVIGGGQASQFETAKKSLMWAIAGAIIINVAYALVQAVRSLGL